MLLKALITSIYYLPGRNGTISEGLGRFLRDQCELLAGREVSGDLKGLVFEDQLETIRKDLLDSHWHEDGQIVANSYGAYLLLHTLIDMESYPGNIFLLSPILGAVQTKEFYFRPPQAKRLLQSFKEKTFPKPQTLNCIVGKYDWQSVPERCVDLCDVVNGRLNIEPDGNHVIEPNLVQEFWQSTC
jgi:hypothetical protein